MGGALSQVTSSGHGGVEERGHGGGGCSAWPGCSCCRTGAYEDRDPRVFQELAVGTHTGSSASSRCRSGALTIKKIGERVEKRV